MSEDCECGCAGWRSLELKSGKSVYVLLETMDIGVKSLFVSRKKALPECQCDHTVGTFMLLPTLRKHWTHQKSVHNVHIDINIP